MQKVRDILYYRTENEQPFGHEDLMDEDKEEDLADQFHDAQEPDEPQQRWMAPSLLGGMFWQTGQSSQQPETVLPDEVARRGGLPQKADAPRRAARKEMDLPLHRSQIDAVGCFEKRSPWWVEGWRPRSYLLKDGRLLYFPKNRPDRPIGSLDFSLARYEVHCCWAEEAAAEEEARRACDVCDTGVPEDYVTFFLKPQEYPNKVFAFRGPLVDMQALAWKIADLVRTSPTSKPRLQDQPSINSSNFWRFPHMSDDDFRGCAECGDLLLFRGTGGRCQLIRCVTTGRYDHVALVLRSQSDNLLVLESTGTDGVALTPWKNFVGWGWHKCYQRIAFRKVYFKRDHTQMQKLQEYVYSILGARYSLTYDKVFKKSKSFSFDSQGFENTPEHVRNQLGDGVDVSDRSSVPGPETFFCSELVAACLKRCGVLEGTRASATYWPSSFSQHDMESLPLHEGVHIGPEQTLYWPS